MENHFPTSESSRDRMKNILNSILSVPLTILIAACGAQPRTRESSLSAATDAVKWRTFVGKTYDNQGCSLKIAQKADGSFVSLQLGPYFRVTTPILGGALKLGTFDTAVNMQQDLEVKSSGSRDGDTITGSGWHVFRDRDDTYTGHRDDIFFHKVVVKPSLAFPRSVTYSHKRDWRPYYFGTLVEGFCSRLEEVVDN